MHRYLRPAGRIPLGRRARTAVRIGLAVTLAVGLSGAAQAAERTQPAESPNRRVIVLLSGEPALAAGGQSDLDIHGSVSAQTRSQVAGRRAHLRTAHDRLLDAAHAAGIETQHRQDLTGLVNAVALTIPAADRTELSQLDGVRAVVPDERVRTATTGNISLIGAPEVWQRNDRQGRAVRGSGTTIAVIGTGIDYTHPALGGGFGPGHKVVGGYDFVNDDPDPMDDNGHGTHVAGVIAGDGPTITGVAPAAQLTAYKVLNKYGGGFTSDVIAGLEQAVSPDNPHRADVVNLSISGPGNGNGPLGRAATAASELGTIVVVAAGNSGPGAGTIHGAAAADGVLSVGASVSGIRRPAAVMVAPHRSQLQTFRAPYSANPPREPVTGELVDVGRGTEEDYERVGDVTGKVVAIEANIPRKMKNVSRYWLEQARRAEKRGAIALLTHTNFSGPVLATGEPSPQPLTDQQTPGVVDVPLTNSGDDFRMDEIVVLGLRELQWAELDRALEHGPVRIQISGTDVTDQVASFSARGPTPDFGVGPDLVAPGVEILSTLPTGWVDAGLYRYSGTSVAAAHVAGSAALLRQLYPQEPVGAIRARLVGSAAATDAEPTVAGAGRVDVASAAATSVTASPSSLSFGLADLSQETVSAQDTVVLHNHAAEPVEVSLRTEKAANSAGTVTVSPHQATIPAGGELEVRVQVSAQTPETDQNLSGWVVADVAGDHTPAVRVPYLLAVRHLIVRATPDPSYGRSSVFVWSPTAVIGPPVLTVTPPHKPSYQLDLRHDHGRWWRAVLHGGQGGAYTLTATVRTDSGVSLTGTSALEVIHDPTSIGHGRTWKPGAWQPVGPNGAAGDIHTTPADPDMAAVTQYTKTEPWVTRDGGDSWHQLHQLPVAAGAGDLIIDAQDPRTMWYAVNGSTGGFLDVVMDPTYQGRILRTHDGGRHWDILDAPNVHYSAFLSDPDTQVLIAVSAASVQVSRDGGDTWSAYPNPVGNEVTGAAIGGEDLYLATSSGVWAVHGLVAGVPSGTERVYRPTEGRVDGLVADSSLVAVLTSEDTVVGSRDGATSWRLVYDVPDGGHFSAGAVDIVMHTGVMAVLTYRESNYISRDHGASWSAVPRPLSAAVESDLAAWTGKDLLWASNQAGMYRTDANGKDATRIGVQGLTVYDMAVTESVLDRPQLLAGTISGTYRTDLPTGPRLDDRVAEWGRSGFEGHNGTVVGQIAVSPHDPSVVWKVRKDALDSFWVYRSTSGGAKWQLRGHTAETPMDIMVSPHNADKVVVPFWSLAGSGLYVTRDGGDTWKKLFHKPVFTTVVADPNQPGRLWLGSTAGLYRSDDFGATVHKVAPGPVTAIGVEGSRIVIGGTTLRVSTNHGKTFHRADSGGLAMRVSDIQVSPTSSDTWYAATTSYTANGLVKGGRGVLRSTDGGQTWDNISTGLENLSVASLALSPDGRWLYAGTVQGGVHRKRTH